MTAAPESRVLLLVPSGRDDGIAARVLAEAGVEAQLCVHLEALIAEATRGAGALIIAEEMLAASRRERLESALAAQPAWSDLPVLLLSAFRRQEDVEERRSLRALGNVTVLERPVRLAALLSAVKSALRARARQYELRDQIRMMRESQVRERERAAELESLLRAVPAAIWIAHDARCRHITGNPVSYAWLRMTGGNVSADAPGAAARGFVEYRGDRPLRPEELPMQRAVATAQAVLGDELELRFADGARRHLLGNAVPLLDEAGAPRGAIAAFVDMSEQKAAERAMRGQAERLKLLSEAAAVVLQTEDPDTMLQHLFERIGEHVGLDAYFSFEVVEGARRLRLKSWVGVPAEKVREIAELDFGAAVCGRVAESGRMILVNDLQNCGDAAAEWVRSLGLGAYVSFPLLAEDALLGTLSFGSRTKARFDAEEIDFLATLCHYVTLAAERVRLVGSLREADRRKDEFLATLAHELRNPLAPIRQAAALACRPATTPAQVQWSLALIERQVKHMALLLDDLLDVSRISRGRLELRRTLLEVDEVVRRAIETARPHIEARDHLLEVALPERPMALFGDPLRLSQALCNLLTNAAKYTAPGGRVRLDARRDGEAVEITVADNGIGIAPEQLERVFEMFTQGSAPAYLTDKGLGIGLAVARGLVTMHGGTLVAESGGVGHGARFVVRLPLARPAGAEDAAHAPEPPREVPSRRVLVVDDNVDAAESLAMLLRVQGHAVDAVHDGEAAMRAVAHAAPEVVFLDLGMPDMDGYEVARRLRALPAGPDLTLVALTGWGQAEDRRRTRAAGFDHHLTKPVDLEGLDAILLQPARDPAAMASDVRRPTAA